MNIELAKVIPMCEFLTKLDVLPYRDFQSSALYKSPLRQEKTASFRVNKLKNVWYDHGTGVGGSFFQFIILYLKSQRQDHTASDALRFINNIWGTEPVRKLNSQLQPAENEQYKLKLKSLTEIKHPGLIKYLEEERCIPIRLAKLYFKEADVFNINTRKSFKAISMKNDNDGYELKNKLFKGCINGKDITFIKGLKEEPNTINIFEGMMDYASVLVLLKTDRLPDDTIILNSLSCLSKIIPMISNTKYKFVYSWFDNDAAGEQHREILRQFVNSQDGLHHVSMHVKYQNHKDVNEWLVHQNL